MTTNEKKQKKPFWLLIEEEILALGTQDVSEAAIKQLAGALDEKGGQCFQTRRKSAEVAMGCGQNA
ncbi:MAG: hypothetical protein R2874_05380 [Desulfobacterales bacterium]